jgi:methyl-accepting chemotaxis protein
MSRMTSQIHATADDADNALRDVQSAAKAALKTVELIEDIAEKTNLLALNASIEAARAGQHGHAFGVVADQVRALSSRVSKSSTDINSILSENANTVRVGIDAISQVQDVLAQIDKEIRQISQHIEIDPEIAA